MDLNKFLEKGFSSLREDIEREFYEEYFMCIYEFDLNELDPSIKWDDAIKMILARYNTEIYTDEIYRPGTYSCFHITWDIFRRRDCIVIEGNAPENLR